MPNRLKRQSPLLPLLLPLAALSCFSFFDTFVPAKPLSVRPHTPAALRSRVGRKARGGDEDSGKLAVGDVVNALCPDDDQWYPGAIGKINDDGTFSVKWDDPEGGPDSHDVSVEGIKKIVIFKDYKVGERVEAVFPDDGYWYPGEVTKVGDVFTVKWDDPDGGPEESEVQAKDMKYPPIPFEKLEVGQKYQGTVRSVLDFGAFVDIGAEGDGLLHISQISQERIDNIYDVLSEGQQVEVWISGKRDEGKFGLTMMEGYTERPRRPMADLTPFADLSSDEWHKGVVARTAPFGAFVTVTLDDGSSADGLVHVSKIKDTPGSIAILMAGTLNRFHLESTAKHLVAPLRAAGWNVDYFASVFVGNANVFDAEMQHVSFEKDPIFAKFEHLNQTNLSFITSVISSTLTRSGAKVPYARAFDRHDTATEDLSFIDKSMMWWRVKYGRTARENFIRMLKELEMMWHAAQKEERKQKQQYSYVLIVRDDVWWLKDFDLDLLVRTGGAQKAIGRNAGHVYSAPCKNRPTKGLVDHVFLFDRSAAEIMGLSYSRIVRPGDFGRAWLEHLEAEKPKNSENFYMQLANFSGFEINEVRGALLPMQRTGRLNSTVCLHKYCDIVDPVLPYKYVFRGAMPGILYDIPDSEPLFRCKDLATLYSAKSV